MKKEQKRDIYSGMDEKNRAAADRLVKEVLSRSPENTEEQQEMLLNAASHITWDAFYIFHKLAEGVYDGTCNRDAFTAVLFLLARIKPLLAWCDLAQLEEDMRLDFFRDLYRLDGIFQQYFVPEPIQALDADSKTYYGVMYTMLCNYSDEVLPIYFGYPFDTPIHIKCDHCGNAIHSVLVNPRCAGNENEIKITPRLYETEEDGLNYDAVKETLEQERISESKDVRGEGQPDCEEWDTFTNTMRFLTACGEENLSKIMELLYGTHVCARCGKSEVVMESHKSWDEENGHEHEPKEEFIEWLMEQAQKMQHGDDIEEDAYIDPAFLYRMAVWYEKGRKEPNVSRMYRNMLKFYSCRSFEDVPVNVKKLQSLIRRLEKTSDKVNLAQAYHQLAGDLRADFRKDERNRYDLSYLAAKKAVELFAEVRDEAPEGYRNAVQHLAIVVAESEEGSVGTAEKYLLDWIAQEEKKDVPDRDEIGTAYNRLAYLFANCGKDYKKVYAYYDCYLTEMKQIYGEESDFIADCLEELAEYHEEEGDLIGECELREKALEINLRELGKLYLLPPIFKGIAVSVAKAAKVIDEDEKYDRVMSVVDSYEELSDLYAEIDRCDAALECLKKATELLEWEFRGKWRTSQMAQLHLSMGEIYDEMGEDALAKKEYQTAKKICETVIEEDRLEEDVEECQDMLEECEDLFE